MNDVPTAEELLEAVARVLAEQVMPETDGATRHAVRVAANLCRIASRDAAAAGNTAAVDIDLALAALVGQDGTVGLARALDERLRNNDPEFDAAVADLLLADVCRRVDIAKPGYRAASEPGE